MSRQAPDQQDNERTSVFRQGPGNKTAKSRKATTRNPSGRDQTPGERLHNGEYIIVRNRRGSITVFSPGKQAEQEEEPEIRVTVQSKRRASYWPVSADSLGSNRIN